MLTISSSLPVVVSDDDNNDDSTSSPFYRNKTISSSRETPKINTTDRHNKRNHNNQNHHDAVATTTTSISTTTMLRSCLKKSFVVAENLNRDVNHQNKNGLRKNKKQQQQQQQQKQKSVGVRFHSKIRIYKTLHLNDYNDKEYDDCFLNKDDYNIIHEMFLITQQLLLLDENEDENSGLCYRGIYEHTKKEITNKTQILSKLYTIIHHEQKYQLRRRRSQQIHNNNTPVINNEYLAHMCQKYTSQSVQDAIIKAKQDEDYVFLHM